jgi:hypothetical protein
MDEESIHEAEHQVRGRRYSPDHSRDEGRLASQRKESSVSWFGPRSKWGANVRSSAPCPLSTKNKLINQRKKHQVGSARTASSPALIARSVAYHAVYKLISPRHLEAPVAFSTAQVTTKFLPEFVSGAVMNFSQKRKEMWSFMRRQCRNILFWLASTSLHRYIFGRLMNFSENKGSKMGA